MKKDKSKKEEAKKSHFWLFVFIGILVVFGLVSLILVINANSTNSNTLSNENLGDSLTSSKNCRQVQVPYEETETYTETVPYTKQDCDTKEISYNIQNTAFDYDTCNEEKKECDSCWYGACNCVTYCIDRTVSCSLDLTNLDSEDGGTWAIKHIFYDSNQSSVATQESSVYLYPSTTKHLQNSKRIQSEGKEGIANTNINSCNYIVTEVPEKQICRDVIDYKDIEKTRTVTKYRTEEQCD